MRAVVTRVKNASVVINEQVNGQIGTGFLVLLGVGPNDTEVTADKLADKICNLRVFEDENEKMNLNLEQVGGSLLVVSQFTLYADTSSGCLYIPSTVWPTAFQFDEPQNVAIKVKNTDTMATAGKEAADLLTQKQIVDSENTDFDYRSQDMLEQAQQLQPVLLKNIDERGKGTVSRDWVGRDAAKIAAAIGLNVPQETRLLFVETTAEHPFAVTELMMPVLPVVRVANVADAIALAVKLEGGCHHTAAMHSRNIENMNQMANAIDTSIFVKNGPCIAGLGLGGEGWTTMTITTPTGEGVTSARTFVRLRRCVLVDAFRIV